MTYAISLLVLLLSMCGAQCQGIQTKIQTESQGTGAAAAAEVSTQVDVSAELKELRDMVVELLAFTQKEVQSLKKENAAQEAELRALKTRLADDREKTTEKFKVAFSAGLTKSGSIEAGSNDLNLVFSKVITNVGQAYSSTTGFFTAPVRGVYYFRFTVMDNQKSKWMHIRLVKNEEKLLWLSEFNHDGTHNYLSGSLTLQLEVGDAVNMVLPAGRRLYSSVNNHSTFTGFLIFPL